MSFSGNPIGSSGGSSQDNREGSFTHLGAMRGGPGSSQSAITPNATASTYGTPANSSQAAKQDKSSIYDLPYTSSDAPDQTGLFRFSEELHKEERPVEPWFLEMSRLRRMYILWVNKRLAQCRKNILQLQQPTDQDMKDLGEVLHLQAEAVRDLETIRSMDYLPPAETKQLHERTVRAFPTTAKSMDPDVHPFKSNNYRRLRPTEQADINDGIRETLLSRLPVWLSWPQDEKEIRREMYDQGFRPRRLSDTADRLARFIIAMIGALFILVPMYIMALHQSPVNNLVTTTVAVVLFALVCSIPLKLTYDQTFSATVGYAAVLMVFVGLTSAPT